VVAEDTYHKAEKVAADATDKTKTFIKTTADKAVSTIKKKPVVLEEDNSSAE